MARAMAQKRSEWPFFPRSLEKRMLPEQVVSRFMARRSLRSRGSAGIRMERFSSLERKVKAKVSLIKLVKVIPSMRPWP